MRLGAFQFTAASLLLVGLAGCGGGGSSTPPGPVVSTLSFPLQSAFKSFVANGATKTFTVSSGCSGSGNRASAPANTAATFEGVAGFSAVQSLTMSLTNCTPASTAVTYTSYYDANYIPLGFNSVGVNYGVYLTAPVIAASVTVGNTGTIGTTTLYTDSTKAVGNGRQDLSYIVEADTASTAIVNLIAKVYNSGSVLTSTEQVRYRIASTGALVPISDDIQYANTSTLHLIITYN